MVVEDDTVTVRICLGALVHKFVSYEAEGIERNTRYEEKRVGL